MPTGSIRIVGQVAGVSFDGTVDRTNTGGLPVEVALPAAVAGSLTTRTDDNTGVVTTVAAHGLTTSDKVDVFWAAGCRYGMDATVAGLAVTVDGGAGDNLPIATTAVTIVEQVVIDCADFDADLLTQFAVQAINPPARMHIQFQETGLAEAAARDIASGEVWFWSDDTGTTNPMATKHVTQAMATNASLVPTTLHFGALYTA
jgi:hypothetical protein